MSYYTETNSFHRYTTGYVDRAPTTSVVVGHPVVIGGGINQTLWADVWIEVVKISDSGALPGELDRLVESLLAQGLTSGQGVGSYAYY